jgi:hypothetical protein
VVARINTSKSISKALNYNEQKVLQRKAEILGESGFIRDVDRLNFYDKLNHFERFTSLNDTATTNTLHVSLNFDPSEKISNEKMLEIAEAYMNKIGFGEQPYLVYRHYDSGHPHLHIVSTNIERNGKRISMHNLGRNQSEKARREIEVEFDLVKAEEKKNADTLKLQPVDARKVTYGKSETRRAIANVLGPVINQYKFSSLAELNAVLKLYNIVADPGQEGSRIYRHDGLTYRILDEQGNKVGIPQKASAFFMKPTLANLGKKFVANEPLKTPHRKKLQTTIGWILNKQPTSLEDFMKSLEKENISVVLRKGKEGIIYGITYVDHKTKCVFNGSDLGKQYSAKAILEKWGQQVVPELATIHKSQANNKQAKGKPVKEKQPTIPKQEVKPQDQQEQGRYWTLPLNWNTPATGDDYMPYQLKKKKKRKRKGRSI